YQKPPTANAANSSKTISTPPAERDVRSGTTSVTVHLGFDLPHTAGDELDHLVDVQLRAIHELGIFGPAEGGDGPARVSVIALADLVFDAAERGRRITHEQLFVASCRARLHARGEEELRSGLREHDRPDVPPLHHHTPV